MRRRDHSDNLDLQCFGRPGLFAVLVAMTVGAACADKTGPATQPPHTGSQPAAETPEVEQTPEAETAHDAVSATRKSSSGGMVALADSPSIDLIANRYLWHIYRDGLVLPMAAEGMRKYSQEYRRPWGSVVTAAGKRGRVLKQRSALLHIPWEHKGKATIRAWLHGVAAGQKVQFDVNGQRVGVISAAPEWRQYTLSVPAGRLKPGENQLRVFASRAGAVGGAKSYGLYRAIELVPGEADKAPSEPPQTPVAQRGQGGAKSAALTGLSRLVLYTELPASAHLDFAHAGAEGTRFKVTARTFDSEGAVLLEADATESPTRHQISLEKYVGRLVALEFSGTPDGAWLAPRIGLEKAGERRRPGPYKNAVLVVVDALRSDRLSVYGETRVSTPKMSGTAEKSGVVFAYNQAASPSSPPSHGSIQTGMIPRVHGVVGDKAEIKPGTPTVSTQLGDLGVATAYYGNNPFGMARLEKPGRWTEFHQTNKEGKGIDCTVLVREMLDFAERQTSRGKRFFISSLPYEPHTPYRYHEGISDKFHKGGWGPPVGKNADGYLLSDLSSGKRSLTRAQWGQLKALYDGEVEHMDRCFGELMDGLAKLGVADETAIILTSDHGEGMYEHGKMGHAYGHYAELGNVPLVVYAPGFLEKGVKVTTVTGHIDIVPTIVDLLGGKPDRRVQGMSLVPLMTRSGPWTPRVISLEYGRSYALRAARWKYIVDYQGREYLFDLLRDPTEQKDLISSHSFPLRYLRDINGFFLDHRSQWHAAKWGDLNNHSPGFVKSHPETK